MSSDVNLTHVLRLQGYHLTRQRLLVLDILREMPGHPDAGMIYQEAKKRDDRISLATVYRSLDLLIKAGLVEENRLGEDHGHYETTQEPHHYHFTCIRCGKIIEFSADEVTEMLEKFSQGRNLQVTELHLLLRGYCPDCQNQ